MNHVANQLFKIEGKKMKKVLLATTALVMTTGYAAAEVSFSGKASAGIYSLSTTTAATAAVQIATSTGKDFFTSTNISSAVTIFFVLIFF